MIIFKAFAATVMFVIIGGCTVEPSANTEGSINFAAQPDGGGTSCGIPIKFPDPPAKPGDPYEVSMDSDTHGCDNDQYNYVRLDNVPSATKIVLRSDYCHDNDNKEWTFWLTTYIHPTTTGWIYIGEIGSKNPGQIIQAGLRLDDKEVNDPGDFIRELSCVIITRSALP